MEKKKIKSVKVHNLFEIFAKIIFKAFS
jgi:hypothetical protein